MEGGEGMVAVVRGLRDSELTVTLLDGSKQYTLVSNAAVAPAAHHLSTFHDVGSQHSAASERNITCDSGAQVTDGRYVSTYKTTHCRVRPTSPPVELTEFPPQRADVCRGPVSPRASREPDAFASSLRQYPQMSMEKSSEIVERLISYTQAKNLSRINRSPPRLTSDCINGVNDGYADRFNFKSTTKNNYYKDYLGTFSTKKRIIKESPTRDTERNYAPQIDTDEFRNVVNVTGITKKESGSINVEVQAAAAMSSKKVDTMQIEEQATALHESSPSNYQNHAGDVLVQRTREEPNFFFKSTQKNNLYDTGNYSCNYQIHNKEYENSSIEFYQRRKNFKILKSPLRKLLQNSEVPEVKVNVTNIPHKSRFATNTETPRFAYPDRNKNIDIYRNEVIALSTERCLKKKIMEWIKKLPIKMVKMLGRSLHNDNYVGVYVEDIYSIITCNLKNDKDDNVRKSLLNLLSKIPMNIYDCHKIDYLNQEINSLINKLKIPLISTSFQNECNSNGANAQKFSKFSTKNAKYTQPREKQLADLIYNELSKLLYMSYPSHSVDFKNIVGTMLADSVLASMHAFRDGKENNVVNEIVQILQKFFPVTTNYLNTFANKLVIRANKIFTPKYSDYFKEYTILVNSSSGVSNTYKNGYDSCNDNNLKDSIMPITKEDIDENVDIYINQLSKEIDLWLQENQIEIPSTHNRDLRLIFIYDLAQDIVDRHKYLEFNPSSRGNDEIELEHLKYFIYKQVNKLLSIENVDIIKDAAALMQKIKTISEPMLRLPNKNFHNRTDIILSDSKPIESANSNNNLNDYQITARSSNALNQTNLENLLNISKLETKNVISSCGSTIWRHSSLSMKQLNEYYDNFLKNWVNEIPIPFTTQEEREIANKARQGIYNGIWKAVTKLKFNPEVFHDSFYYEDILENDIDELFNCLPETPELKERKHILKVKLINQTRNTNDMIRTLSAPSSYRQKLVDVVARSLPLNDGSDKVKDLHQEFENIQIQKVVDDFILCKQYKQCDKSKAEIYGKQLVHDLSDLIRNQSHIKELKDTEPELYVLDIINTLNKFPSPDAHIIKEEANLILLGHDIQQWLTDLPFNDNSSSDQSQILMLKNNLMKRIMQLVKDNNALDCSEKKELKRETVLFLKKLPLKENLNLEFLAQELFYRIKNRVNTNNLQTDERKKSLALLSPVGYYEFRTKIPSCSSFSDLHIHPIAQNQSSYIIKDGERVKTSLNAILPLRDNNESNEYFTIPGSPAHDIPDQNKCVVPENHAILKSQSVDVFSSENNEREIVANSQHRLCQSKVPRQTVTYKDLYYDWQTSPAENNRKFLNQIPIKSEQRSNTQTTQTQPNTSNICVNDVSLLDGNRTKHTKSIRIDANMATPRSIITQTNPEAQKSLYRSISTSSKGQDVLLEENSCYKNFNVKPIDSATATPYIHSQGFSTPRQLNGQLPTPKLNEKCQEPQRFQHGHARRKLSLETDTIDDTEKYERCCCKELMSRLRRGPCYFYEDFDPDDDGCYPYPFIIPY